MLRSRPKPKGYDAAMAEAWHKAVCRRGAKCVVCGCSRGLQSHHAIGKTVLERVARSARLTNDERNRLLWDERNGVPVCAHPCHEHHTNAYRRIPRECLPAAVWDFARAVDALLGTQAGTRRVEAEYPCTSGS